MTLGATSITAETTTALNEETPTDLTPEHPSETTAEPPKDPQSLIKQPQKLQINRPFVVTKKYGPHLCSEITYNSIQITRLSLTNFMNATAILKSAGIEKKRRKKILQKLVALVPFEKVVEGWHAYQGVYVPLVAAKRLAETHGVYQHLQPLFDHKR